MISGETTNTNYIVYICWKIEDMIFHVQDHHSNYWMVWGKKYLTHTQHVKGGTKHIFERCILSPPNNTV